MVGSIFVTFLNTELACLAGHGVAYLQSQLLRRLGVQQQSRQYSETLFQIKQNKTKKTTHTEHILYLHTWKENHRVIFIIPIQNIVGPQKMYMNS